MSMAVPAIGKPAADEYAPFFAGYIARVRENDILQALHRQKEEFIGLLQGLSDARAGYRYAEGKWSVREIVGHVIDAERVFGYRALAIARGDRAALPGFDENDYTAAAGYDSVPLKELLNEFSVVRDSHLLMFPRFSHEAWVLRGTASGHAATPRALAHIIVGHARHHAAVLSERYLGAP
jgi:hypothetical protein